MSHVIPKLSRVAVLEAIALCDRLGLPGFLGRFGFGARTRYQVRHNGRCYPSKAIAGVASGLSPAEFSGGMRHAVDALRRLGFEVREGSRSSSGLVGFVRSCLTSKVDAAPWPTLPVEPAAYFASGSNRPGEIRGLASIGHDIGVAAPEVSEASEAELLRLAGSDVRVFVDSGAFSEVNFGPAGVEVVKPIDDAKWREILNLYRRLGAELGGSLFVVAPDMVGSQDVTLRRLRRYAPELRELSAAGVNVLVVAQKGALSQAEFFREALELVPAAVPAIPCKKAATSADELRAFVEAVKPAAIHLLGKGIRARDAEDYISAATAYGAKVSLDSNWIRANVGHGVNRPRRYTRARDFARLIVNNASTVAELAIVLALGLNGS